MKYRKKPVVIDAMQYNGTNRHACMLFLGKQPLTQDREVSKATIIIQTDERIMQARVGDWLIRGIKGEYYPCKPEVFDLTYEKDKE